MIYACAASCLMVSAAELSVEELPYLFKIEFLKTDEKNLPFGVRDSNENWKKQPPSRDFSKNGKLFTKEFEILANRIEDHIHRVTSNGTFLDSMPSNIIIAARMFGLKAEVYSAGRFFTPMFKIKYSAE